MDLEGVCSVKWVKLSCEMMSVWDFASSSYANFWLCLNLS